MSHFILYLFIDMINLCNTVHYDFSHKWQPFLFRVLVYECNLWAQILHILPYHTSFQVFQLDSINKAPYLIKIKHMYGEPIFMSTPYLSTSTLQILATSQVP